jgi:large subunit ribosomal protein L17
MASRVVRGSEALSKLFHDVAPRLADHKGGYTRLLKTRLRPGDAAPMAFVEIVARGVQEEAPAPEEKKGKKKAAKAEAAPEGEKKAKKSKKAAEKED